jgi:hypothetical protein
MARKVLLIHGYSSDLEAMLPICRELEKIPGADGKPAFAPENIFLGNYVSLDNTVSIPQIAAILAEEIRKIAPHEEEFDAIVHSTGMLVVRAWLAYYYDQNDRAEAHRLVKAKASAMGLQMSAVAAAGDAMLVGEDGKEIAKKRLHRLKHLVGVAPATWGSPQATMGRTTLGELVKGSRKLGPEFLNSGDQVLDALELGSAFTWDLAHRDLLADENQKTIDSPESAVLASGPYFGSGPDTPYVAVFIGNQAYSGVASVANDPGTDGTVRWSGAGLNTRKISLDLTQKPPGKKVSPWANDRLEVPILPVDGRDHGTLIGKPDPAMISLISDFFLHVDDRDKYEAWLKKAKDATDSAKQKMRLSQGGLKGFVAQLAKIAGPLLSFLSPALKGVGLATEGWQQFVVRAVDSRGEPVKYYLLEVFDRRGNAYMPLNQLYLDVHAYRSDPSFRCFHIQLPSGITADGRVLYLRASTQIQEAPKVQSDGKDDEQLIRIEAKDGFSLFCPFTTTLVELRMPQGGMALDHVEVVTLRSAASLAPTN